MFEKVLVADRLPPELGDIYFILDEDGNKNLALFMDLNGKKIFVTTKGRIVPKYWLDEKKCTE